MKQIFGIWWNKITIYRGSLESYSVWHVADDSLTTFFWVDEDL